MATPVVQSVTTTDFGVDATTHNANMPATVNAGDLLLAFVAFDTGCVITTPAGWTRLSGWNNIGSVASACEFAVYAKDADGTEDSTTVNWATDAAQQGTIQVYRITGWGGGSRLDFPIVALLGQGNANQGMQLAIPFPACDVLWIYAQCKSSVTAFAGTPTNYANTTTSGQDATTGGALHTSYRSLTANFEQLDGSAVGATAGPFAACLIAIVPQGGYVQRGTQSLVGI